MRCVVTAGPTYEPLDQVRRLTNFSTGRLGSELVNYLADHGHEPILLIGQQATYRGSRRAAHVETFTTTADLSQRLQALAKTHIDAVFHAAAVSDFAFGAIYARSPQGELVPVHSGKISTRQGTLLAELVPTPKIIQELRGWYPSARLFGWKYEVEGTREQVLERAAAQIKEARTDYCIANGTAYGAGFGLIRASGDCVHLTTAPELYRALEEAVMTGFAGR